MSTAYNTSAKPRSRRDTKSIERTSRASNPNDVSQVLSKNTSRTSDETQVSNDSRPGTPASLFQKYEVVDRDLKETAGEKTALRDIPGTNMGSSSSQEKSSEHEGAVSTTLVNSSPRSTATSIPGSWPIPSAGKQSATVPAVASKFTTPRSTDESPAPKIVPFMTQNSPEKGRVELVSSPPPTARSTTAASDRITRSQDELLLEARQYEEFASRGRANAHQYDPRINHAPYSAHAQTPQQVFATTRDMDERSTNSAGYSSGSPPRSPPPHHFYAYPPQNPSLYPYIYPQQVVQGGYTMYANPYHTLPAPVEYHPQVNDEGRPWRPGGDDEHNRLVERLTGVLPDIDRLLSHYRDTRGQMAISATPTQASQSEHAEELRSLRIEVEANKREYEKIIDNLVGRNNDLEGDLILLRGSEAKIDRAIRDTEQAKHEMALLKNSNQKLIEEANSKQSAIEILEAEKADYLKQIFSLEKQHESTKDLHSQNLRDIREQHRDQVAAANAERETTIADHKVKLSKVQLELANLITKHNSLSKDLEAVVRLEAQRKAELEINAKKLDELSVQHIQDVKALKSDHQKEIEELKFRAEDDRKRDMLDAEAAKRNLLEDHNKKETRLSEHLNSVQKELENCQNGLHDERDRHAQTRKMHQAHEDTVGDFTKRFASWNAKHLELQAESQVLDTLLHSIQQNPRSRLEL